MTTFDMNISIMSFLTYALEDTS